MSETHTAKPAAELEARKVAEAAFHDERERDRLTLSDEQYDRKYSNTKWYSTTARSHEFIDRWLRAHVPGRRVLDYCCGLGGTSQRLAEYGAVVHGIDISRESIETARRRVRDAGLADRATFEVMDAERTTLPDASFDVIVCSSVLHHLDVARAFPELRRLLKPDGVVFASEALGYNPIIAAYRKLTPHVRTGWEEEHILTNRELRIAARSFESIDVRYFHLFSIAATPFRRTRAFGPLLAAMNWMDSWVLRVPGVRLMAWQMLFTLRGPRASAPDDGSRRSP